MASHNASYTPLSSSSSLSSSLLDVDEDFPAAAGFCSLLSFRFLISSFEERIYKFKLLKGHCHGGKT